MQRRTFVIFFHHVQTALHCLPQVVEVRLDSSGRAVKHQIFASGWAVNSGEPDQSYWGTLITLAVNGNMYTQSFALAIGVLRLPACRVGVLCGM